MRNDLILVIEDSSKVGISGGQIVSRIVTTALIAAGYDVYFLDLSQNYASWGEIFVQRHKGHGLVFTLYKFLTSINNRKVIYSTTKKTFLISCLAKLFNQKIEIYHHAHSISKTRSFDVIMSCLTKHFARHIFYPSEFCKRKLEYRLKNNGIHYVIGNPVVHPATYLCHERTNQIRIGFVGRLNEEKGFNHFIAIAKIFESIKNTCFVAITNSAPTDGLHISPNIKIHTRIKQCEVASYYDILLILSNAEETYSLSAAEAALSGKVIIALDRGAISEVIGHYSGLYLYNSLDQIKDALFDLILKRKSYRHPAPCARSYLMATDSAFSQRIVDIIASSTHPL